MVQLKASEIFIKNTPIIEVDTQCLGLPSWYPKQAWQTDYCWSSRLFWYDYTSKSCSGCKRPRWFREKE